MTSETGFVLRIVADGHNVALGISEQEFRSLQRASAQLDHLLDVEEKYDVTIQNYLEFEISALEEAAREMVRPSRTAAGNEPVHRLLARRLSNILSSARLYLDTLKHPETVLLHDAEPFKRIEDAQEHENAHSLRFRFLNAVRHHAQHRSLPVHGLIGNHSDPGRDQTTYSVNPYIDVDLLREDKRFDGKLLDEVEKSEKDVIPLKPVLRSYMESLGAIQKAFRDNTETPLRSALQQFHDARDRFVTKGFRQRAPSLWELSEATLIANGPRSCI